MPRRPRSNGGRVTPKRTRPRSPHGGSAPLSVLPAGLDELLPHFDDDLAVFRDAEAASFVAIFSTDPHESNVIDLRGADDEPPSAREVLAILSDLGPRPAQRVVDTVAAFAAYGGAAAAKARRTLRSFRASPSPAAAGFGQATITSTTVVEDIFDETVQYLFGLRYPDGSEGALAVLIDRLLGGVLKDTLVIPDVATFTQLVDDSDEVAYRPGDIAAAAAAIDDAYEINDMTLGIDTVVADDVAALRPLIETLLAPLPRVRIDREPLPIEDRERVQRDFAEWAGRAHPDVAGDVVGWSAIAIDFSVEHGHGDPLKWAPNSILAFLEWASRTVRGDPRELREIPEMLRIFVPWAHTEVGWGDRYIDEALDAIERAMPLYEDAITGSGPGSPVRDVLRDALADIDLTDPDAVEAAIEAYNSSLDGHALDHTALESPVVPVAPAGGSHPEPFDGSDLGGATERVASIAELASVAGRAIFDEEYVTLIRRLAADAARTDPSLFAKGRSDIWAAGLVYAVAQLNDIVGGWGPMSMLSQDLMSRLAGAPGTITAKAAAIRNTIGDDRWAPDPRYQHGGARYDLDGLGIDFDLTGFGRPATNDDPVPAQTAYPRLPVGSAFVLRCELVDLPVSRTLRVPAAATLRELHLALQVVFDWYDGHLHQFTIGRQRFSTDPDLDWAADDCDDATVRLDELVRPGAVFEYVYDFGDNWELRVHVIDAPEPEPGGDRFELVAGAGDAPPEDCGGPWGYQNLIAALGDTNHPDHDELREWAGDFRPGSFDLVATAARLRRV
jgi:Plasmid pRiA4b ORF-3-like protein/Domain of unknown function (DUF6398)